MPVDLIRRFRERAGVLGAALTAGGAMAASVAEAGKKRRNRGDSGETRRADNAERDRSDRRADREDRQNGRAQKDDDVSEDRHRSHRRANRDDDGSGRHREHQQTDDSDDAAQDDGTDDGGGGGRDNDPVGGRAGDAADKLRHRAEKLTGFDGKQNDGGGNNDTGTDYDGEGIDASVDPQTGAVEFDNGNISFIQDDDGSATIVTDNIELERGPDPKPFDFPPLELPEDDGLPTVPGSAPAPPAGDGTEPGASAGDGGNANAGADGGTIDTGVTDNGGGDNTTGPLS